jgi:hypothetical protein
LFRQRIEEAPMAATTEFQTDQPVVAAHAQDVADSRSTTSIAVRDISWKELAPALPEEVIALVAPLVVVTAETL